MYRTNEFDCEERKSDPKRQQYSLAWKRSWVEKIIFTLVLYIVWQIWDTQMQPAILDCCYDGMGRFIIPEMRIEVKKREAVEREMEKELEEKKNRRRKPEDLVNFNASSNFGSPNSTQKAPR
jgi:hypothetical protein